MSTILFVTWDGGGNVPPALGIGAELQARGHDVLVLGHERQREPIAAAGLAFTPYHQGMAFSCLDANSPATMMALFSDPGMGADLLELQRERAADLVVIDCLLMGAMDAARRAGLTYVPLEHLFDDYLRRRWLRGPLGQAGKAKGLRPVQTLNAAPLTMVASLPELDPASRRRQPANLVYTGPVVGSPDERDLASREPTVLASLSTYAFPGMTEAMQTILDAVADLPARILVTTGPVIEPASLTVPANAEVHRYVDHDQLMPEATLLIGHGGHATTMRALAHDLPLVVMPMHPMLDQPMVGAAVQRAGAGRRVTKDVAPDALRRVVAELVEDGPHRAAAARLGAAIRATPGATGGADALEELLVAPSQNARAG